MCVWLLAPVVTPPKATVTARHKKASGTPQSTAQQGFQGAMLTTHERTTEPHSKTYIQRRSSSLQHLCCCTHQHLRCRAAAWTPSAAAHRRRQERPWPPTHGGRPLNACRKDGSGRISNVGTDIDSVDLARFSHQQAATLMAAPVDVVAGDHRDATAFIGRAAFEASQRGAQQAAAQRRQAQAGSAAACRTRQKSGVSPVISGLCTFTCSQLSLACCCKQQHL